MFILIFVTVGSRNYPFDRLFIKLDELFDKGILKGELFAQIGTSTYKPRNFKYKNFISQEEFSELINKADIVVSHGASGSIMKALNAGKKVIAVTRLAKYGEHIDDHQIQIVEMFTELKLICGVLKEDSLEKIYVNIDNVNLEKYISNTQVILDDIKFFLEDLL